MPFDSECERRCGCEWECECWIDRLGTMTVRRLMSGQGERVKECESERSSRSVEGEADELARDYA